METLSIRVDDIEIGERHRALSEDAVQRLAGSIKEIGLKSPISIRIADDVMIDGKPCDGVPILVAGAHRLAAVKSLGWSHIDCFELADDAIAAELWEIAENLHRCDLSKEQRDEHIRRYAELLASRSDAAKAISFQDGTKTTEPAKRGRPQGVAGRIAQETGLSKQTVLRALNPPSPRADPPKEVFDVHEQARRRLMSAWNGATEEDRQWFRDWIDAPVFDNTRAA